ncbi:MAG: hypothetical protein ACOCV2_05580, partial [Persicimonas sp.]
IESNSDPLALHDQINKQAEEGTRRIFTSFASGDSFDYEDSRSRQLSDESDHRFLFRMNLAHTDQDEFDGSYLEEEPEDLDGSRITFEFDRLDDAIDEVNSAGGVDEDDELDLLSYFQVEADDEDEGEEELRDLIDEVRGRSDNKEGRAFGAISNSSPVAVEPPNYDIPIDSYRRYKTLYEDRPSMLYVATLDGLLHGIHAGELKDSDREQIRVRNRGDGSMHEQRESWAYLPQMLHDDLALYKEQQPELMDGTPIVQDVRLCHRDQDYNQNRQACHYECSGDDCGSLSQQQWRTVLVNGLGESGAGYMALDVTRSGGKFVDSDGDDDIQNPDPAVLWEFDPSWERGQVEAYAEMGNSGQTLVWPRDEDLREGDDDDDDDIIIGDDDDDFIDDCEDEYEDEDEDEDEPYFWNTPFMGASVGQAAIGTVRLDARFLPTGDEMLRRPIAVFTGGAEGEYGPECDRGERSGRAVYVVDMQTGTLLRRFVSFDYDGDEHRFPAPVSGSPALYDNTPGSLTTRGFVGDADGRLFRIDMTEEDPRRWTMELFFNPYDDDVADDLDLDDDDDRLAPADYRPAITKGSPATNGDILVYYGLGAKGELGAVQNTGLMIGLRERIDPDNPDDPPESEKLWHVNFEHPDDDDHSNSEALTGEPVIFNQGVFFTTFVEPGDDRCMAGWSRIYGMSFEGKVEDNEVQNEPLGIFTDGDAESISEVRASPIPDGTRTYGGDDQDETSFAYEPEDAGSNEEDMIVRGLTITTGPSCTMSPDGSTGGSAAGGEGNQPTLMAQSSASGMDGKEVSTGGDDALYAMEHGLSPAKSQQIPLSWSVIDN